MADKSWTGPTNEEFEALRERVAELDTWAALERADLRERVEWLIAAIESDPRAVRMALGLPLPEDTDRLYSRLARGECRR